MGFNCWDFSAISNTVQKCGHKIINVVENIRNLIVDLKDKLTNQFRITKRSHICYLCSFLCFFFNSFHLKFFLPALFQFIFQKKKSKKYLGKLQGHSFLVFTKQKVSIGEASIRFHNRYSDSRKTTGGLHNANDGLSGTRRVSTAGFPLSGMHFPATVSQYVYQSIHVLTRKLDSFQSPCVGVIGVICHSK